MLREMGRIIEEADSSGEDGERLEIELRHAAQHLWRSQFLYQADWGSKGSYELIQQYKSYFENLFAALGYRIVGGRPSDHFMGLLAIDLPPRQKMKLEESLLLLVLRLYYEEAFKRYEMNDAAEIEVDGEKILQIYEERTHRVRPSFSVLQDILTGFRQRGLVRTADQGDNRNFTIFLRPALPIVIGEDTLASLEEYVTKAAPDSKQEAAEATND
jgi:Domain of unknown function (DUF4194)